MKVNGSSGPTAAARCLELVASRRAAARADVVERDGVGDVAGRVDGDDVAQLRQALADGDDLRDLLGVLADDADRLGVAGDPLALLGRVRRVDRHDDAAGAGDREVRVGPLGARVAEDADALAGLRRRGR